MGTKKKSRKKMVLNWFTTIIFSFLSVILVTAQMESPEGKPCDQSFHCWRTEPVGDDGMPLQLSSRINIAKRLDIPIGLKRGAKCRCRQGFCQYFLINQERFLPCDEF
uniref:Uncharacterized protein n=1 Tax=Panagrolaimus sp. JU765 TaxID=591449 RepID=A0AC34RQ90_9BILA